MIEPTDDLDGAAALILSGGLVAAPTETVYGLAADATNGAAVARIFEAKGRPSFNPLIVHVPDVEGAWRLVEKNARAERLAAAHWPGPLTLVLPLQEGSGIHPLVTAGLPTLGVRRPVGSLAELAKLARRPLAAPSANPSGQISATSAEHVVRGLGARLDPDRDAILRRLDGPFVGVESTILALDGEVPRLLRAGGLAREEIERTLGEFVLDGPVEGAGIVAPGMMASHYAPRGTVRLDAEHVDPDEFLIGFGAERARGESSGLFVLSRSGDLAEAARNLFAALHAANAVGARSIAVEPIPRHGLGEAINDRLARAAAPR